MKKMLKRLCTGFLALATVVTALPTTPVHAESKQYWTESAERVGIIEKVMNDGSIGSTFNEGMMKVEGETAYCIDINISDPTKEVTDIRAIQLNSSFTQVTFFRFIADGFKNIFIHNKTSRISSVNNYIYLFGGALAS